MQTGWDGPKFALFVLTVWLYVVVFVLLGLLFVACGTVRGGGRPDGS